jgi:hypothetical protein
MIPGLGNVLVIVSVAGFLPIIALNTYSAMLTPTKHQSRLEPTLSFSWPVDW